MTLSRLVQPPSARALMLVMPATLPSLTRPTHSIHPTCPIFCSQEAEEFAEQDKAVKARIDAKNQLETYAYNLKSTVEDKAKDKVGVVFSPLEGWNVQLLGVHSRPATFPSPVRFSSCTAIASGILCV